MDCSREDDVRKKSAQGTAALLMKIVAKHFEARKACLRNAAYVASPFDFDRNGERNS
jgi:hypothetical protein